MKSNVTGQEKDGNMRPPREVREKDDYRQAGKDIEIEDVLDKKKRIELSFDVFASI